MNIGGKIILIIIITNDSSFHFECNFLTIQVKRNLSYLREVYIVIHVYSCFDIKNSRIIIILQYKLFIGTHYFKIVQNSFRFK